MSLRRGIMRLCRVTTLIKSVNMENEQKANQRFIPARHHRQKPFSDHWREALHGKNEFFAGTG